MNQAGFDHCQPLIDLGLKSLTRIDAVMGRVRNGSLRDELRKTRAHVAHDLDKLHDIIGQLVDPSILECSYERPSRKHY